MSKLMLLLFRLAPYSMLNYLRNIEHLVLSRRSGGEHRVIDGSLLEWNSCLGADRVLVIDDAVDSGASMKAVLEFLSEKVDRNILDSFSVVVTQDNPVVNVDYSLYKNVLIRFPWSLDFHKNDS